MRSATQTGINFGLTSGVITTLGLIVGLHSGTHSTLAIIGGILTIAIADSLSDALGIHISKEAETDSTTRDVWLATFSTLATKMIMASSFMVPILILEQSRAIVVAIVWGMLVLTALSYFLARSQGEKPHRVIAEHLAIAILVIIATHFVGDLVAYYFQ